MEKLFEVIESPMGWYFYCSGMKKSKIYLKQEQAVAAARRAKENGEAIQYCRYLAKTLVDAPHIRLTLIRLGLAQLGRSRLDDFLVAPNRQNEIREKLYVYAPAGLGEASLPLWYRRHTAVINELIYHVDFDKACNTLSLNCDRLVDAILHLLASRPLQKLFSGQTALHWVSAALGIEDVNIRQDLASRLLQGTDLDSELSNLSAATNGCEFSSHVHLLATVLSLYYVRDITSSENVRMEILRSFTKDLPDLRTQIGEEITACVTAVNAIQSCSQTELTLKGGMRVRHEWH